MKKIISLVLVAMMVLSSVAAFAAPSAKQHTVQNNIYIEGKVGAFVEGEKLYLTITKGEEVVYVSEYNDVVGIDGSYVIKFKHTGDLTGAEVNVKYAGEDVTSGAVNVTSTTQIMEADVYVTDSLNRNFNLDIDQSIPEHTFDAAMNGEYQLNEHTYQTDYEIPAREGLKAVVNLNNTFGYEGKVSVMVAAYNEAGKLLDCKVEVADVAYGYEGETQVAETAVIDVPANTASAKAFCWSSLDGLVPYGKEAVGELPKVTVFCIGDSTGHTWKRKWYPQAGWGTYLQDYLDPEYATVYNNCTSGAWAQSILNNPLDKKNPANGGSGFYGQGDWQEIEALWKEGDYVLVCLGINDAAEGDINNQYTDTEWFGLGYQEMIKRASDAGVTIIFISATPSAASQSTRGDFNAVAKKLAEENGLVYLDHASKMLEVFNQSPETVTQDYYLHRETFLKPVEEGGFGLTEEEIADHGNEAIRGTLAADGKYYYNGKETSGKDTTHISIKGANLACQKIVECLAESESPLRFYVK